MDATTSVSPFTLVPRRIPFFSGGKGRQRLGTFLIFSLPPTALFWTWFLTDLHGAIPDSYSGLRLGAPLASLWITFGPLLMQQGEFNLERLLRTIRDDEPLECWDTGVIQRSIDRADRAYYWVVVPSGLAAALSLPLALNGMPPFVTESLDQPWQPVAGMVVLLQVGFTSASGIWGAAKGLGLEVAAIKNCTPPWSPFRPDQAVSVNQMYTFAWSIAVIFSVGAIFVPALLSVHSDLTSTSFVIVTLFVVPLVIGGPALFVVPVFLLYRLWARQKRRVLGEFGPTIQRFRDQLDESEEIPAEKAVALYFALESTLHIRQAMMAETSTPSSARMLARGATTLLLPAILTAVQILFS